MLKIDFNQYGMTLLEIVLSLVLLGIISVFAGMGIVMIMEGYFFTKDNAVAAQKAQIAMARMVKEFNVINAVTAASNTSITFSSIKNGSIETGHSVNFVGSNLYLDGDDVTGDLLVDNVAGFELAYYNAYNDATKKFTWDVNRHLIEITLTLKSGDNNNSTFVTRVAPRNI